MFGTVAPWMRTVNVANLVMGTLMAVDEALKLRRGRRIVKSENNRFAAGVPDSHSRRYARPSAGSLNEVDGFPFVVGAGGRGYDIELRRRLRERVGAIGEAQCQANHWNDAVHARSHYICPAFSYREQLSQCGMTFHTNL